MADLSSADGEKVVLVHISERARPVRFRGNNEDLKIAIRDVFVMYFQTARNSFFRYVDPLFVLSVIHEYWILSWIVCVLNMERDNRPTVNFLIYSIL